MVSESVGRLKSVDEVCAKTDSFDGASARPDNVIPIYAGQNFRGEKVRFRNIYSVPLLDRDGDVIGVSFPMDWAGARTAADWAELSRESDTHLHPRRMSPAPFGGGPAWSFDTGDTITAPWAADVERLDLPPVYVIGFGSAEEFRFLANTGSSKEPLWEPVSVKGDEAGRIIDGDQYFNEAWYQDAPVALTAGHVGSGSDPPAAAVARVLQAGHQPVGAVHAPTVQVTPVLDEPANTSYLIVDQSIDAPYVTYSAPEESPLSDGAD
ncbi:hypothetical protein [Nocardia colli]|uniref:hypothetical protein n=1 Tax=Nocardia colli TaxID=2545717 RepID=UPI0035DBBCE2